VKPVSSYAIPAALSACQNAGSIYYLTRNLRSADNALLKRLQNNALTVLTLEEPDRKETAYFGGHVTGLRTVLKT
jgi:hypothetical protein